jgi:hypothetical protein
LRDETTLLVLMVRVANQERQEEWEKNNKKDEGQLFHPENWVEPEKEN